MVSSREVSGIDRRIVTDLTSVKYRSAGGQAASRAASPRPPSTSSPRSASSSSAEAVTKYRSVHRPRSQPTSRRRTAPNFHEPINDSNNRRSYAQHNTTVEYYTQFRRSCRIEVIVSYTPWDFHGGNKHTKFPTGLHGIPRNTMFSTVNPRRPKHMKTPRNLHGIRIIKLAPICMENP